MGTSAAGQGAVGPFIPGLNNTILRTIVFIARADLTQIRAAVSLGDNLGCGTIRVRKEAGVPVNKVNSNGAGALLGADTTCVGAIAPGVELIHLAVDRAGTVMAVNNLGRSTARCASVLGLGKGPGQSVRTSTT